MVPSLTLKDVWKTQISAVAETMQEEYKEKWIQFSFDQNYNRKNTLLFQLA